MLTIIASLLIAAVVFLLGAAAVIFAGLYDVAATTPHWSATSWLLETTRTRSVKAQAAGIVVPPGITDPAKVIIGVEHYAAHCAVCHGAPGVPKGDIARGLNPLPPDLAKSAQLYSPAELFWIVKHGIVLERSQRRGTVGNGWLSRKTGGYERARLRQTRDGEHGASRPPP